MAHCTYGVYELLITNSSCNNSIYL